MSKEKDARWGVVYSYIDPMNLDFEDFTFSGWQKLLDRADNYLELYPESVDRYKSYFDERNMS